MIYRTKVQILNMVLKLYSHFKLYFQFQVSYGTAAAAAKLLQSCPTLHDPTDGSPPGSPVPGILQARTLEWVAISFSTYGTRTGQLFIVSCKNQLYSQTVTHLASSLSILTHFPSLPLLLLVWSFHIFFTCTAPEYFVYTFIKFLVHCLIFVLLSTSL